MSQSITSVAGFFRAAAGKEIIRTAVNMLVLEDWDANCAQWKADLVAQGLPESEITIDDTGFSFPASAGQQRHVRKPKIHRTTTGTLTTRSADYMFIPHGGEASYGQMKGLKVENGKLIRDCLGGGHLEYQIA